MKTIKIILAIVLFVTQYGFGQSVKSITTTIVGKNGTWLPVISVKSNADGFFNYLNRNEKIIIYRTYRKNKGFVKIAEVTLPASANELSKRIKILGINEQAFIKDYEANTIEEAYEKLLVDIEQNNGNKLISFTALLDKVQLLWGISYLDKTRDLNKKATYKIDLVNKASSTIKKSITIITEAYKKKEYLRMFPLKSVSRDSVIITTWGRIKTLKDLDMPYKAYLFKRVKNETQFQVADSTYIIPQDTLKASFNTKTKPLKHYEFYLGFKDYAGNEGELSEELNLLSVTRAKIPSVYNLKAKDTVNGVYLSWDKIGQYAFYTGIEIQKSQEKDAEYNVLDTIPISKDFYLDKKTTPSEAYYYKVRPLLLNYTKDNKLIFAKTFAVRKPSDKTPDAPTEIEAKIIDKAIKISWKPSTETQPYGYFVYRGTSAKNLEFISNGIVKDTVFTDTTYSKGFSGTYYYGVKVKSIGQKTSKMSSLAILNIIQPIELPAPSYIFAKRYGNKVEITWDDLHNRDKRVENYILLRKNNKNKDFTPISENFFTTNQYIDSQIATTDEYVYKVLATDKWGNTSKNNPTFTLKPDYTNLLFPPKEVQIISMEQGINIEIPELYTSNPVLKNRKYIIYRKSSTDKNFNKIGETSDGKSFMDYDVVKGTLYEYVLSAFINGKEGQKSIIYTCRK